MSVLHREDQKVARLRTIELFKDADKTALKHLASACDEVTVKPGTVLITQGHHHREGYVVAEGQLSVMIDGEEVATVPQGQVVGELALLTDEPAPASATVVAKTEAVIFVIPYNRFDEILDDNPTLTKTIARQLASRLRSMDSLYRAAS